MPLATVKPKFHVTMPAKLRKDIDLREGDIMEVTLVGDATLVKPRAMVNKNAVVDRIAARIAAPRSPCDDRGPSEHRPSTGS